MNARLRRLPKVDDVLRSGAARRLLEQAPRWAVVSAVRGEIEALRARLLDGGSVPDDAALEIGEAALACRVESLVRPRLRRVLNATGVVLHTNLGRAPLAERAIARVGEVARGYCNLEYRLDEPPPNAQKGGKAPRRGSRHDHAAALLAELTGAESALVVNNCAAAVLLAIGTLAAGREVIVSRGELVEIGGSFRVPDVMRASGARLVEVGTTNRTHLADYQRAIGPETALLLKVHRSNFAIVGFTAEVGVPELVALAARDKERGLPVMVDLGSGCLLPTGDMGLGEEPTVQDTVAAGADVVTFSGDKLLGGPQSGVLLARRRLHDELRTHPLLRALRPDKLTLAALTATLELYRDGRTDEIPALAMLRAARPLLERRAERLRALIAARAPQLVCQVVEVRSAVGGGALPLGEPPSMAVAVAHPAWGADALEAHLRAADPPLVARIADGRLLADVRTIDDRDLEAVAAAFASIPMNPVAGGDGESRIDPGHHDNEGSGEIGTTEKGTGSSC